MKRKLYATLVLVAFAFGLSVYAQNATPSPDSVSFAQGSSNLGLVQPIALSQIMLGTGINSFREAALDGAGARVGVIDRGFGGITALESDMNLRISAFVGSLDSYNSNPIGHGTDVVEVIATIVPSVEFYLCEYRTLDEFTSCIDWFISSQVKVINHSAGVPSIPLDGLSPWSQELDRATSQGILWVNAAGNFANGVVTDFFTDSNTNGFHEYRGSAGVNESLFITGIEQPRGRIMLSWAGNNNYAANEIDLGLEILDQFETVIAQSENEQSGNFFETALEIVEIDMRQAFGIRITNNDGRASDVRFALYIEFAQIPTSNLVGSIISPADSLNAISVGALRGEVRAPYSSHGPIENGALKPDIVAPGEVVLRDGRVFIGTSVSAPIVTASIVLIMQAHPDWGRSTITNYLRENAIDDREIPGDDNFYGEGKLNIGYNIAPITPSQTAIINIATSAPTKTPIASNQVETVAVPENMVLVQAGCFTMGSSPSDIDNALQQCIREGESCEAAFFTEEGPQTEICFSEPFWIDRTEVTNAAYGSAGQFSNPQQPRDTVSWFDAYNYCQARGGRLPSEAEWEYAARGSQNSIYPWGNEFIEGFANYRDGSTNQTAIVGSFPLGVTWVGAVDMSGNLWEWTNSIYSTNYPYNAQDGRESYNTNGERTIRGGSWLTSPVSLRTTDRDGVDPAITDWQIGFRCVKNFDTPRVCTNGIEPRLPVGGRGRVLDNNPLPINFREFTSASNDRIGQIPAGAIFDILEGPICNENYNWYRVSFAGIQGWIIEGNSRGYSTEPAPRSIVIDEANCRIAYYVANGRGCANEEARSLYIAFQRFERGFMIWRSDADDFFIIYDGGRYAYYHSETVSDLADNPIGSDGRLVPISGFGRIWGNTDAIRETIGWATENEFGADVTMQSGEANINGVTAPLFYLTLPDGRTLEVVLDGSSGWRQMN